MMDIQKAIKELKSMYFPMHSHDEAINMAVKALREQAERGKGCEYCTGDALDGLILTKFCGEPNIALHGGNCPPDEDEKPVCCPKCGRRLK